MSLVDTLSIPTLVFDIDGTDYTFSARNVVCEVVWVGKKWQDGGKNNRIKTQGYHLRFEVSGADIAQTAGTTRDSREMQTDLNDDSKVCKIQPDSSDSKEFTVIGTGESFTIYSAFYGGRNDDDIITCETKDLITATDIHYFIKR
jgi:hypothetical protein